MQRLPKGKRNFSIYIEYDDGNIELKIEALSNNADVLWLNYRTELGIIMLNEIGMHKDSMTKITSNAIRRAPEYENAKIFKALGCNKKHKYIWTCTLKLRKRHDEYEYTVYICADE